jgi:hypothetical protein
MRCDVRYDFSIKAMFGSSLPPVVCSSVHVLLTLFVFALLAHIGVQHIICCVFALFVFVLSMLPFSLDFPFLIAPSVFSNVYLPPFMLRCQGRIEIQIFIRQYKGSRRMFSNERLWIEPI